MDQIFDFKAMKDAGINFSVKYLDSDLEIMKKQANFVI